MRKIISLILMISILAVLSAFTKIKLNTNDVPEASGLCASLVNPGMLYTHNDSGGKPVIYILNTKGDKGGEWVLSNAKNRDWEEIAVGPGPEKGSSYVYVGDIGDNNAKHKSLTIYRFKDKKFDKKNPSDTISEIDKIDFQYDDGARDAEAFFVDPFTKDIIIISKREMEVRVYKLSYPQKTDSMNTAVKIGTIPYNFVSAATISSDGKMILVKTYGNIKMWKRKGKEAIETMFLREGFDIEYEIEPQGEAVCFDPTHKMYYTLSEKNDAPAQYIHRYKVRSMVFK